MLEKERALFDAHAEEWAKTDSGKYALVKDEDLIGFFNTIDEALEEGATRFGLSPFLVRQVGVPSEVLRVPALMLGLLHASS